jgi:hypothetical protein
MTTSGSSDFTRTRDQLCRRALRICGVVKSGETPGAQTITDVAEALNAMVKRWQKKQIHVWTVTEGVLFPQAEQVRYDLGSAGTDHATETYYQTELTADASSGATTISVDDTASVAASDHIGTVLADGTVHWSTVASKSSSSITIASGIADAASDGAAVFTYTTGIVRPLKIVDARRYDIASGTETPISESQGGLMARLDYMALPNKAQTGTVTRAFYDPRRSDQDGHLYLWQPPATVTDIVKFTWHRPIMDFDSAADNPDLDQEWFDAIAFNLALSISTEFDVTADRVALITQQAAQYLDDVSGDDREGESLYMQVDMAP